MFVAVKSLSSVEGTIWYDRPVDSGPYVQPLLVTRETPRSVTRKATVDVPVDPRYAEVITPLFY